MNDAAAHRLVKGLTAPGFDGAPCGTADGLEHLPFTELGRDGVQARLGIMGGTFDPIHMGHLNCAERASDALDLDAVLFIPAGNPAFKQDQHLAPADARFAMCKLAVANNPAFDASDIELRRDGITYTIDTLEALKGAYAADVEFVFIIGTDAVPTLHEWRDAPRLAKGARFACVARPGYAPAETDVGRLRAMGFTIDIIDAPTFDVSSSDIRARCGRGSSIRYLVPHAVGMFIESNELYA